jgi:small basic protein (TIGR04137 family)
MSIHSSLRAGGGGNKHRSVLKRYERLKALKDKSLWSEDKSVLGIPKVKMQRIKVKKEKAAAEAGAGAAPAKAEAAAAPAKAAAAPGGKTDKK